MLSTTDDLRISELKELTTPQEVIREIPRTLTATRVVLAGWRPMRTCRTMSASLSNRIV